MLINGYAPSGVNAFAVWDWMFLFGHLIWATGFMFLISWRGYWQELIETIVWAHEHTAIANLLRWKDKPVALSIVQARFVGLAHFSVGISRLGLCLYPLDCLGYRRPVAGLQGS